MASNWDYSFANAVSFEGATVTALDQHPNFPPAAAKVLDAVQTGVQRAVFVWTSSPPIIEIVKKENLGMPQQNMPWLGVAIDGYMITGGAVYNHFYDEIGTLSETPEAGDTVEVELDFGAGTMTVRGNGATLWSGAVGIEGSQWLVCVSMWEPGSVTADFSAWNVAAEPPPPPAKTFRGTVKKGTAALSMLVRAHARDTGELIGEDVSDPITGEYEIEVPEQEPYYLVALPIDEDDYEMNALIMDRVEPQEH